MKLIDVTPKNKFYIITDGKIVAVHFSTLQIHLEHFFIDAAHLDVNCHYFACLATAEGKEITLNHVEFRTTAFYKTVQDALNQDNRVIFTLKQADMPILLNRCGANRILKEERGGSGAIYYYSVWQYVKDDNIIGAKLKPISDIDLLNNEIALTDGHGNFGYTTDWFNSKEECEEHGSKTVEVCDFDEPTPKDDDDDLHIVFIEIIH